MGNWHTKTEINFTIRKTVDVFQSQDLGLPSFALFKKFMNDKGYLCQESENYTGTKFVGPHNFLYRLRIESFTDKIRIIAVYHMHPLHDDAWFYDKLNVVDVNHSIRNYKNVNQKLNEFVDFVCKFIDMYKPVQLYSSTTISSSTINSPNSPQGSSPKRSLDNVVENTTSKRLKLDNTTDNIENKLE